MVKMIIIFNVLVNKCYSVLCFYGGYFFFPGTMIRVFTKPTLCISSNCTHPYRKFQAISTTNMCWFINQWLWCNFCSKISEKYVHLRIFATDAMRIHSGFWVSAPSVLSFYDRFNRPIFPLFHKIDRLHLNHAGIQKLVHFVANT